MPFDDSFGIAVMSLKFNVRLMCSNNNNFGGLFNNYYGFYLSTNL